MGLCGDGRSSPYPPHTHTHGAPHTHGSPVDNAASVYFIRKMYLYFSTRAIGWSTPMQTLHGNVHQVDHVPNGPTNSTAITTMFPLRLCGGKLLVAAVTRERRYGPSRLRVSDDDDWKWPAQGTNTMPVVPCMK